MTQPVSRPLSAHRHMVVTALDWAVLGFLRHSLLIFNLFWGIFVITPWLAPVLMHTGHADAARAIYLIYSPQCHQLPQRSFFLFGPKLMYSLPEIQAAWRNTNQPAILRQFIGNPEMGWKVAWSDRMVSMYISIFVAGLFYALVRRRLKPLSLKALLLFILPLVIDGSAHLVSDFAGIGNGFRDSNTWLAALTGQALPAWFYAGDGLGSFNSSLRLITGVLFGVGVVWFIYPHFERFMGASGDELEVKLRRRGVAPDPAEMLLTFPESSTTMP
ncbi:MAG: DUF2085 domain-containing protein [Chloroflexi bacterium]|nr:DUF2085 domain-containing protein [Chloroflexota bacterium]